MYENDYTDISDTSPLELANLEQPPTKNSTEGTPNLDITPNNLSIKEEQLKRENRIKELEKSLLISPPQIVTRSKGPIEPLFLKTPKRQNKKMTSPTVISEIPTTMAIDKAFKFIPYCSGEENITQFINACDIAVNSVDLINVPLLIRYLLTKLSGKPAECLKYKDTSKWVYIKKHLEEAYASHYSSSALQLQINSIKMNENENVKSYTDRLEKLYYQLANLYTTGKNENDAKAITKQLAEQTLALYIKGFIKPIRTTLRSRDPKTLEQAKSIALQEELDLAEDIDRDNFITNLTQKSKTNLNIPINQNYNSHPAQQRNHNQRNFNPRFNNNFNNREFFPRNTQQQQFNNHNYNNQPPQRNELINTNNNNRPPIRSEIIMCSYCGKRGHSMDVCYSRQKDAARQYTNSGNATPYSQRAPRTVQQIRCATENYNETPITNNQYETVFTSYQQ